MNSRTVVQLRDVEARHHERLSEIGRTFAQFPISFSSFAGFGQTPIDTLPRLSGTLLQALAWYRSDQQWFPRSYFDSPPTISEEIDGMFEARFFSVFGALRALVWLLPTVKPLYDPDSDWTSVRHPDGDLGFFDRHNDRRMKKREELWEYHSKIVELDPVLTEIYQDFRSVMDSNWSAGWY